MPHLVGDTGQRSLPIAAHHLGYRLRPAEQPTHGPTGRSQIRYNSLTGGVAAVFPRWAHNPETAGAIPAPGIPILSPKLCSRDRRHSLRGLLPLMAELDASEKVCAAIANDQGIPSESDLEDALNWAECATFQGSQKQINWARAIATTCSAAIALAHKQGKQVPTDAKWWIDNRDNIVVSLPI